MERNPSVQPWLTTRASKTPAIAKLTNGPAMATKNSCMGFSGMDSMRATPPIGKSMMSLVLNLKRLAIRAWPNSCRVTHRKTARLKMMFQVICTVVCLVEYPTKMMYSGNIKNVQCMDTLIPAYVPNGNEPHILGHFYGIVNMS